MNDLVCGKDNKIPTSKVIEAINNKAEDDDFQQHVSDKDNPHQVTPDQIGAAHEIHQHTESDITDLDKYTKQEVDDKIGETDTNLNQHRDDKNNPHETTPEKIGAAHEIHNHTESDIVDLDKYTQAEIDVALTLKADITDVDAQIITRVEKTSDTGSALIPKGTIAQRDVAPVGGEMRLNTESGLFEGHNGTAWGAIANDATVVERAEAAAVQAELSKADAEAAQVGAETAQGLAEAAQANAEIAQAAAESSETGSEAAVEASETAQVNAETAQANAEIAQSNAEIAQAAAETAQGLAEIAQTAAEVAQASAELAKVGAETAEANAGLVLTNKIDSITTGLSGATKINSIVGITQAGYNASSKNANTLYFISG